MRLLRREWTDFEKWIARILGGLIVAGIVALAAFTVDQEKQCRPRESIALLLGYEAAMNLGKVHSGKDITREIAAIKGHLKSLGIEDINYPSDPGINFDEFLKQSDSFSMQVLGRLRAGEKKLHAAFRIGWSGSLILGAQWDSKPKIDLEELTSEAELPNCGNRSDVDCLEWLAEEAWESKGPICS